jgi:hemerythrin-like metal-binding protein
MDAEHQSVYRAMDQLREELLTGAPQNEIVRNLRRLSSHLGTHFLEEERLMRKSRYTGLHWHENQHRAGLAKLADMDEAARSQGHNAVIPYLKALAAWLTDHITVADRMFTAHLRNWRQIVR